MLEVCLQKLEACAASGCAPDCISALRELVPTYKAGNGNRTLAEKIVASEEAKTETDQ